MSSEKNQEQQLRRALAKQGYQLKKSRSQKGYMIVDLYTNAVVRGSCFELELDDVADFVNED